MYCFVKGWLLTLSARRICVAQELRMIDLQVATREETSSLARVDQQMDSGLVRVAPADRPPASGSVRTVRPAVEPQRRTMTSSAQTPRQDAKDKADPPMIFPLPVRRQDAVIAAVRGISRAWADGGWILQIKALLQWLHLFTPLICWYIKPILNLVDH